MTSERQQQLIERLLLEAEQAVLVGDWTTVSTRCTSILALQPEHPEGTELLQAAARATKTTNKQGGSPADPRIAIPELIDAETALDAGDSQSAWELADQVLAADKSNMAALLIAAEAELIEQEFESAATYLDTALAIEPENIDALLMRAEVAGRQGDDGRVRALARSVLRISPKNDDAQLLLNQSDVRDVDNQQSRRDRLEQLNDAIAQRTLRGWTLVDRNDSDVTATLSLPPKRVNHVLHLLLSIVTFSVWLIVWFMLSMFQRPEKRVLISIDRYGQLSERQVSVR